MRTDNTIKPNPTEAANLSHLQKEVSASEQEPAMDNTHSEEVDGTVGHIAALLVLERCKRVIEAGRRNGADFGCLSGGHETGLARGSLLGKQSE